MIARTSPTCDDPQVRWDGVTLAPEFANKTWLTRTWLSQCKFPLMNNLRRRWLDYRWKCWENIAGRSTGGTINTMSAAGSPSLYNVPAGSLLQNINIGATVRFFPFSLKRIYIIILGIDPRIENEIAWMKNLKYLHSGTLQFINVKYI